jgi:uncharacterized protein (DUF983 family)
MNYAVEVLNNLHILSIACASIAIIVCFFTGAIYISDRIWANDVIKDESRWKFIYSLIIAVIFISIAALAPSKDYLITILN